MTVSLVFIGQRSVNDINSGIISLKLHFHWGGLRYRNVLRKYVGAGFAGAGFASASLAGGFTGRLPVTWNCSGPTVDAR
jgi:hypothetical protein